MGSAAADGVSALVGLAGTSTFARFNVSTRAGLSISPADTALITTGVVRGWVEREVEEGEKAEEGEKGEEEEKEEVGEKEREEENEGEADGGGESLGSLVPDPPERVLCQAGAIVKRTPLPCSELPGIFPASSGAGKGCWEICSELEETRVGLGQVLGLELVWVVVKLSFSSSLGGMVSVCGWRMGL